MNAATLAAILYVVERFKEKSTWVALGSFLTACGIAIAPQKWDLIMTIGMGLPSLIAIFIPARVQEKNVVPAPDAAPTTALAQSLADKVSSGQTEVKQ